MNKIRWVAAATLLAVGMGGCTVSRSGPNKEDCELCVTGPTYACRDGKRVSVELFVKNNTDINKEVTLVTESSVSGRQAEETTLPPGKSAGFSQTISGEISTTFRILSEGEEVGVAPLSWGDDCQPGDK